LSKILKSFAVAFDENAVNLDIPDIADFYIEEDITEEEPLPEMTEEEALTAAEQIIADAEEKAEQIINAAKTEGETAAVEFKRIAEAEMGELRERVTAEAYEEGYAKAKEAETIILEEAENIKKQAYTEKDAALKNAEPEIVGLIADIVKKLLNGAFAVQPELISVLVKQGLSSVNTAGDITVHVSESDYAPVTADKDELLAIAGAGAGARIEIIKDLSLNPSDCIIETKFGNIDCSLGRQYESLKESLYFICKNRFAESAESEES